MYFRRIRGSSHEHFTKHTKTIAIAIADLQEPLRFEGESVNSLSKLLQGTRSLLTLPQICRVEPQLLDVDSRWHPSFRPIECHNINPIMPPRLKKLLPLARPLAQPVLKLYPFLVPLVYNQFRAVSILANLSDNPSAFSKAIRVGRGPSSGRGKTSGRGHKGQKQHGKVPRGFNGGQTKDEVVHGKRGDHNYAV